MTESFCTTCEHKLGDHFKAVDGTVRCLHVESGLSSRGILGEPFTTRCDCVNYVSRRGSARHSSNAKKQEGENAFFRTIREMFEELV